MENQEDVDVDNILVSSILSKYSIGSDIDEYKIKSLRIMVPKTSTYVNTYDSETKWITF